MNKMKRVFKWWMGWKPEIIETWLEDMASQGWYLKKVGWGGVMFYFQKGEPGTIRYCVDYQSKKDPNYMSICQDAGWTFIYSGNGWFFWSMPYSGERPEMYTDADSLIERNKRLLNMFTALWISQIPLIVVFSTNGWFHPAFTILYIGIIAIFAYSYFRLSTINKELSKNKFND